jgi:FKBP-type peptidyl-prolyl cis-trans isomerase
MSPAATALSRRSLFGAALALGVATSTSLPASAETSVIDGQGQTRILPLTAEEDLSIPERQVLEYNKRTQRQNSAPPDFPNFVREGFDMTVLTPEGYEVSPEGIIYKDYAEGTGSLPEEGQQVTFDYTAYNESAAVIDSSYRKGQPAQTRIGIQGLIPGFEMGIRTMKPGGKRRIVVPPELGPPVGPSTFFSAKQFEVFDVELRAAKTCVRRTVGMFSDVVCE